MIVNILVSLTWQLGFLVNLESVKSENYKLQFESVCKVWNSQTVIRDKPGSVYYALCMGG
jgi:hypothetical protein